MTEEEADLIIAVQDKSTEAVLAAVTKMKVDIIETVTKALDVDLDRLFRNIDDWEQPSNCIINFDCHSLGEARWVKNVWNKFCALCDRESEKREIYKFKNMNGTFTYRFCLLKGLKRKDYKLDKDGCYIDKEIER